MPASKSTDNPTAPVDRSTSAATGRTRPPRKPRHRQKSPAFASRPLGETPGPDPETPLSDVRLAIGTIAGAHGSGGELKLRLATDDPEQLRRIKRIYIGDETTIRRLIGVRFHKGMALIRVSGVTLPEQAELLRGQIVRISGNDARPLEPGEFYYYQVIGLTAKDEAGAAIGVVSDIIETGANVVFVVSPADGGKDILLPNIPDVILDLDPAARTMVVRPLTYWNSQ
jgi:16S rRNA processing protein RimM